MRASLVALLLPLLAHAQAAQPLTIAGHVVGVHDGDTLTLRIVGEPQRRIRLVDIDAPEMGQPFGRASKGSLSDLCYGKRAAVIPTATDRYGRTVGRVHCDGWEADASTVQLERGMAWAYRRYLTRPELLGIEGAARGARHGLWSALDAVPPWVWRPRAGRPASSPQQPP